MWLCCTCSTWLSSYHSFIHLLQLSRMSLGHLEARLLVNNSWLLLWEVSTLGHETVSSALCPQSPLSEILHLQNVCQIQVQVFFFCQSSYAHFFVRKQALVMEKYVYISSSIDIPLINALNLLQSQQRIILPMAVSEADMMSVYLCRKLRLPCCFSFFWSNIVFVVCLYSCDGREPRGLAVLHYSLSIILLFCS